MFVGLLYPILVLICCTVQARMHKGSSDDVVLSKTEAHSFIDRQKRFFWPSLYEECYGEQCSWEEVKEQDHNNEWGWEYYKASRCHHAGDYCQYCSTRHSCDVESWSQWAAYGSRGGKPCYTQTRFKAFVHATMTVKKPYNCDGVLKCGAEPSEKRTWCECEEAVCTQLNWTPWQGDIPDDDCATQIRTRSYDITTRVAEQKDSCSGIVSSCPGQEQETRSLCNCHYQEDCTVKEWGSWSENIPDIGCGVQVRKREYNSSEVVVEQESCDQFVPCPVNLEESRPMCNCRYAVCGWSDWIKITYNNEDDCTRYERYHNETVGMKNVTASDCNDFSKTCDFPGVEREEKQTCGDGKNRIFTEPTATPTPPATTEPPREFPTQYIPIGCYKDKRNAPRLLPVNYLNLRKEKRVNWANISLTVQECAIEASKARYEYFAVQYFGECWSGPNAEQEYFKLGLANEDKCWQGKVGKHYTNFVYKMVHLPECSSELEFKTEHSSGRVKSGTWCAGRTDEYQWLQADFKQPKSLSGIATQGDRDGSHWVTVYIVEYSEDGEVWKPYLEDDELKLFSGNTDSHTVEITWLKRDVTAQYVRLKPRSWNTNNICMTVRFFGC